MSKYKNKKTNGFDSKKEKQFFDKLNTAKLAADINNRVIDIQTQVKYQLIPAQYDDNKKLIERSCAYIADFVVKYGNGTIKVFDVKSPPTRKLSAYVIKRKLMLEKHNIQIMEV